MKERQNVWKFPCAAPANMWVRRNWFGLTFQLLQLGRRSAVFINKQTCWKQSEVNKPWWPRVIGGWRWTWGRQSFPPQPPHTYTYTPSNPSLFFQRGGKGGGGADLYGWGFGGGWGERGECQGSQPSVNNDAKGEFLINQSEASPSVCASAGWALSTRSPPLIPSRGSAKEQRCKPFREAEGRRGRSQRTNTKQRWQGA